MIELNEISKFLDEYLQIHKFKDGFINGLQIAGKQQIKKIAALVDTSLKGFQMAIENDADMIIVHHGLLTTQSQAITDITYEKIKLLIKNDVALYAVHLPLDAHAIVGNNIQFLKLFDIIPQKMFAEYNGNMLGYIGLLPEKKTITELTEAINKKLDVQALLMNFGKKYVEKIAIIVGSGCSGLREAWLENVDLFITGEPRLNAWHEAAEYKINVICAGHYATETLGLKALLAFISEKFPVETKFLELKCQI